MSSLVGCTFSPPFGQGAVACGPDNACPPGFVCAANQLCYTPDATPDLTAGSVADGGDDLSPGDDLSAVVPYDMNGCMPASCPAGMCGMYPDGCGHNLNCKCPTGQKCNGDGTPNKCCTPNASPCPSGSNCGKAPDGCGSSASCGTACSGAFCGGSPDDGGVNAGTPNFCGLSGNCVKLKCQPSGSGYPSCGTLSDNCGSVINCAVCGKGLVCTNNVCVTP